MKNENKIMHEKNQMWSLYTERMKNYEVPLLEFQEK